MRLTTTLGGLREREGIRVNCIVPDWVATPEVKEYWDALTPEQRREQGVPALLTSLAEIADAVVELIADERLAGRVMVWWSGERRGLIRVGDPGYVGLEALAQQPLEALARRSWLGSSENLLSTCEDCRRSGGSVDCES